MNTINFPAGILQAPFYDNQADDTVNFGGIGAVIGHELTHGFDDQGRQFDAQGNLRDWWTPADAKAFAEHAACIADQYSHFSPIPGLYLNGDLTLGENIADNGGVRIALAALLNRIGNNPKVIDGFTSEQRFFLSFGQIWCENEREESLRLRVQTDPPFTRHISSEGGFTEHAGIPESIFLHPRANNGAREPMPCLVSKEILWSI
jgi:predicted metalloendopeptidase